MTVNPPMRRSKMRWIGRSRWIPASTNCTIQWWRFTLWEFWAESSVPLTVLLELTSIAIRSSGLALRTYNEEQEQEADWLAGCLLLPRDALLAIRRRRLSDEEICSEYGVSPAMLRFRLNITGVDVQLRRARGGRG
jgi:IrrE N-terminal-like domain